MTLKPTNIRVDYMAGEFRISGLNKKQLLELVRYLARFKGDKDIAKSPMIEAILAGAEYIGITARMEGGSEFKLHV